MSTFPSTTVVGGIVWASSTMVVRAKGRERAAHASLELESPDGGGKRTRRDGEKGNLWRRSGCGLPAGCRTCSTALRYSGIASGQGQRSVGWRWARCVGGGRRVPRHGRRAAGGGKREFYLYAIKKDGADLCAIKKVSRTCVPPS
jgi:hypothetical protein